MGGATLGDYNGAGKTDILFQDIATGAYATWDLNNTSIIGGGTLGSPGASYNVAQGPSAAAELPATIVSRTATARWPADDIGFDDHRRRKFW